MPLCIPQSAEALRTVNVPKDELCQLLRVYITRAWMDANGISGRVEEYAERVASVFIKERNRESESVAISPAPSPSARSEDELMDVGSPNLSVASPHQPLPATPVQIPYSKQIYSGNPSREEEERKSDPIIEGYWKRACIEGELARAWPYPNVGVRFADILQLMTFKEREVTLAEYLRIREYYRIIIETRMTGKDVTAAEHILSLIVSSYVDRIGKGIFGRVVTGDNRVSKALSEGRMPIAFIDLEEFFLCMISIPRGAPKFRAKTTSERQETSERTKGKGSNFGGSNATTQRA